MPTASVLEKWMHQIWYAGLYRRITFLPHRLIPPGITPRIESVGLYNGDAGPDFVCVKLRIGSLLWVGNAELHVHASDWHKHKHHLDEAYHNVLLHVILHQDHADPAELPSEPITAILSVNEKSIETARKMTQCSRSALACAKRLHRLEVKQTTSILQSLYQERLQTQCQRIGTIYQNQGNDIATTVHILFARYLGNKVNNDAMERTAASLPLSVLYKHASSLLQLEALFLGQAGLLAPMSKDLRDPYLLSLQEEYLFLKHKYQLNPIDAQAFRLLRIRPVSFPHRRLALLAALYHLEPQLPAKILHSKNTQELMLLLEAPMSEYWKWHYRPGSPSKREMKGLSRATVQTLICNVIQPLKVFYLQAQGRVEALPSLCYELPPEKNKITKLFGDGGLQLQNAADSQAVLYLYNHYCLTNRCFSCPIGQRLQPVFPSPTLKTL